MAIAPRSRVLPVLSALLALAASAPGTGTAQLITLRSVPVASGDQFLVLPTARLGMGGPWIALRDRWLDAFVNPAKGSVLTESSFFGAPTFYHISGGNGAGRTLSLAGLATGDAWFGGASVSLQQIVNEDGRDQWFFVGPVDWTGPARRLDESAARNVYLHGFLGRRLGDGDAAVGGSVSWAGLDAVDGVDLLYQGSDGVDQRGDVVDARLGLFGTDRRGGDWEAMLLFDRVDMQHDVRSVVWTWNDDFMMPEVTVEIREERDRTKTWGLHLGYDAPVSDAGWRLGGIFTANRKTHPKIPDYEIQNIPRDPGDSWAFDIGAGLARIAGPLEFAVDVVFEPIWSDTWSVVDEPVDLPAGGRLEPGDKEVENEFFFSNLHLRMGVGHETERWGARLGVEARSYDYTLDQFDNVTATRRTQDEAWTEWAPSWGGLVKFRDVEVSYAGRLTTGTGRPGVAFAGARAEALAGSDFIVAPSGPLTLQDAHVLTHQLVVRLPIR